MNDMPDRRAIQREVNRQRALDLTLAGATPDEIARELGSTPRTVRDLIYEAFADTVQGNQERAAIYRMLVMARLDRLLTSVWNDAIGGDGVAFDRALKVIQMQAKIIGAFAPKRVDKRTVSMNMDVPLGYEQINAARAAIGLDPLPPVPSGDVRAQDHMASLAHHVDGIKVS